jgi:hypothetical protein
MLVSVDLPQIFAATRLNIFDVQRIGVPSGSGLFAVQRKAGDMAS